jgi:hypothetical protein
VEVSGIADSSLAEPTESTGWLLLHCAIAFRCDETAILAVLEANKEVELPLCPCFHLWYVNDATIFHLC